ncbi:MAG: amidase [Nocardioides sp.]|jgi:amidase
MRPIHAYADDALADHDATGLVEMLHRGQVSSAELVEAALARTERVDADLGAVAYLDADRARREARSPNPGYFSGVPTFIKDNCDVEGQPTQQGTDAYVAKPARRDGDLARLVHATGAITLGKTRLSEFGFNGAVDHPRLGPVRTPWHPGHYAGASSAGSAALVAAGAVPFAHANDGGGSIRIPASVNGLVGLKTTRDRIPQDAMFGEMPVRICSDGVLTRSVRDTAAFLREAERIYRNPKLPRIGDVSGPSRRRLRIGFTSDGIGRSATGEVRDLTTETAAMLESLGHRVEEIAPPVPDGFVEDFLIYWSMLALVLRRTGKVRFGRTFDASKLDNLTHGLAHFCARRLHRLPKAVASLARSGRHTAPLWRSYDLVLTPTLATSTPALGHLDPMADYDQVMGRLLDWVAFTPLANATGEPSLSLPLATTASGLPQGMMFGAPKGRERVLLELAYELEEARPWARIQDATIAAYDG